MTDPTALLLIAEAWCPACNPTLLRVLVLRLLAGQPCRAAT